MTQRQRHASGVVTDPARRPPSAAPAAARPVAVSDASRSLPWNDLYCLLPADRQADLLAIAQRQGVLFGHQLPFIPLPAPAAHTNVQVQATEVREPARQVLATILDSDVAKAEPFAFDLLTPLDGGLDQCQRAAVAGAVQTPDLFLIQGLPGSGKSRVVAEIIRQTISRGERVLLLAAAPSAVDRVLEQLDGDHCTTASGILAVRCLGRDETVERLSPAVRRLTIQEVASRLAAEPTATARRRLDGLESALERLGRELKALEDLEPRPDRRS
jgi:hypothetical protein